ncbi:MAG: tetratricopeptide repeat protein [Silvibacterium sp.]|jgi:TolA-binding protein
MQLSLNLTRFCVPLAAVALAFACSSSAQQPVKAKSPSAQSQAPKMPPPPKPPALVDPAGPAISLQTSEAVFDVAVALNACGYDNGLAESDPIREHIREQVNQATQQSVDARDARFHLCEFIDQHRLAEAGRDLAQYISLALYLTPPPELSPSVETADLPPDSTQVENILPLLRAFVETIHLHAIWVENRPAYEQQIVQLHDPLTKMILDTNIYLKMPVSSYADERFLVVLEPMISPGETNARVYGADYVVVASPVNGTIHMKEVRHTYLHYEIEPLLYARASAMDRLLPFLKTVRDAPLDFVYRSDIVSLVIESMIRAIEARTMQTGVAIPSIPANTAHSELEPVYREHMAALQKDNAVREQLVGVDMAEGYVLTQYFYTQMASFEHTPTSLKESIGEMVYGMDVQQELGRLKNIHFVEEGSADIVRRAPVEPRGLDLAELDLVKGDAKMAGDLSETALKQHTVDPARANFILARADLMSGKIDDAENAFRETIRLSSDPRMVAWAHIYLGRILDVEEKRDDAVAEYKSALTIRDSQPDTRSAAEKGVKQPFALPRHEAPDDNDDGDPPSKTQPPAAQTPSQHPQ